MTPEELINAINNYNTFHPLPPSPPFLSWELRDAMIMSLITGRQTAKVKSVKEDLILEAFAPESRRISRSDTSD